MRKLTVALAITLLLTSVVLIAAVIRASAEAPWLLETPTATATTLTQSPTATPSNAITPAGTLTPTATATLTSTATATFTPTVIITPTATATPTATFTPTATATLTPTTTSTPAPTATATPLGPDLVINEVEYDSVQSGPDAAYEWVELYNNAPSSVELAGWTISDNMAADFITSAELSTGPTMTIPANGFVVIAASEDFYTNYPGFAGAIFFVADGSIGNGLNNDGDHLILRDSTGTVIDQMSYGTDATIFDPPCPDVAAGHSLEREPTGYDTDQASDFVERTFPSPGSAPLPTPTPTTTPTLPPTVPLLISEVCYDGTIPETEGDEFVEIFNPSGDVVDLSLYKIGDEETEGEGEGMYQFPPGTTVGPQGLLVVAKNAAQFEARFGFYPDFEARVSGADFTDTPIVPNMAKYSSWATGSWALSNTGDEVLLLGPADEAASSTYVRSGVDAIAYKSGDFAAVGVSGHISAPAPRSLQRVGAGDTNDMNADFAIAAPNPASLTDLPTPPSSPLPPAALPGGMWAYFGCLHSHSTYSDGSGPPRYAYAVGRANGLHFLALTDHSHYLNDAQWADTLAQAEAATVDGSFVGLRGFEWTGREEGHISVFETDGYPSRDDPNYDSLGEIYTWLTAQPGAIAQFNHPFPDSDFNDFAYDPVADAAIVLQEVGNGSRNQYRTFEGAYLRSLYAGWRVGATNNGDTETPDWGADTPHRTGVVARTLTKDGILEGLRARRTFATEDGNLALALRAGDAWMGSTIPKAPKRARPPITFFVDVSDPNGESVTLELFDRGLVVAMASFSSASSSAATMHTWTPTAPAVEGHFYFAKATQADGDTAYTSPIWVEGVAPADAVLLNEFMPAPHSVDWDDDGAGDHNDEWIELYNAGPAVAGLGGWQLDDVADAGSGPYTIPADKAIPPGGFLVFFKKDIGVSLNNDGDGVRLLRPDGTVADEYHYTHSPGYDRSFSRTVDGGGHWTADYAVTLGAPNHPRPSPPPPPGPVFVTIAETKIMATETIVTVEGQVTASPGIFAEKSFYIQDSTAGTLVYLREGDVQPTVASLSEGDRVRVTGQLWDYYDEREIRVAGPGDIQRVGAGEPLEPTMIKTGEVDEAHEGLLAQIVGEITGWERSALYLDDGSGEARIYVKAATGIERPWVERGEIYSVVGIVSQYQEEHELLPRYQSDISLWPGMLPVTGGESPD